MKTAILMANGPSLNDIDVGVLNQFDLMILNRGYLKKGIKPKYLVVTNDLVLTQFGEEIIRHSEKNNIHLFAPEYLLPRRPRSKFTNLLFLPDEPHFQTNFGGPMWQGHTVTYVGLQLLYQMGYEKVLIVGLDHYYKRAEGKPTNMKELAIGEDPDHFDPKYFKDVYWHTPNLWRSEIAYRIARSYYDSAKKVLLNCSTRTRLPSCIIKRADLQTGIEIKTFDEYLKLEEKDE